MSYLKEELTDKEVNALTPVFARLITDKDIQILKEKGHVKPTDEEKALWVAYGIFNALECSDNMPASAQNFAYAVESYIQHQGGWDKL